MTTINSYDVYDLSGTGSAANPFRVAAGDLPTLTAVSITETDLSSGSTNVLGDAAFDTFVESSQSLGTMLYVGYIKYTAPPTELVPNPVPIVAAVGEDENGAYHMFVVANAPATTIAGDTYKFTKAASTKPTTQWAINQEAVYCFLSGTLISTAQGDRAVEELRAGDMVLTVDGNEKAIRWIGSTVIASKFGDPIRSWPIRIKAGALAENTPSRDLLVSPGHAVLVGDLLVHAGALVNGISIVRETSMPILFSYYHVEVDSHVLLVAENTPCESFIETTADMRLDNFPERAMLSGTAPDTEMDYPRVKASRQLPQILRAALEARYPLFSTDLSETSVRASTSRQSSLAA